MLTYPVVLRLAVIAIIPAVVACNSVLGVDDVAPTQPAPDGGLSPPDAAATPPDAPPADCKVASHFSAIMSSPATSFLGRRTSDGGQTLLFFLNQDAKPDVFGVLLFNGKGGHGTLDAPGMYPITQADSQPPSCGLCVVVYADVELNGSIILPSYFALAQGSLTVTRADSAGMAGHLDNLQLRHVDRTGATLDDGCMVQIDEVKFDMPYAPSATSNIAGAIQHWRSP